jgi:transcriptional regulator of acetoin/glycerol metabolism
VLVLAEPVNEIVRERWDRAQKLGLDRDADGYPIGTSSAELTERKARLDDVLREERELLEPISAGLASGPLVAIVADREGVILSAHADRHFVDPLARVRLVEGARWGEETRGTNAIGTALAERRAVAVVGSAHYELRNRELFCYATPVHDAYGDIVAVLDVTGPMARHDAAVGLTVQAAGVALERALRAVAYGDARTGALAAIERLVHRASGPSMLIEASGAARVVNTAARAALRLPGDAPVTCERLFGVPFDVLVATAAGRGGMRFETRTGTWKLAVDPVAGAGSRTLALLVHLEPEHGSSRAFRAAPAAAARAPAHPAFDAVLGRDAAVVEAKAKAERFARTQLPVLLLAETGTGKELFARAIHAVSERRDRPFVAINCGSLAPDLIASEMFGYAPGSFTGAARTGFEGRVGAADGGTLLLDEIAEMPAALQASLLRVLDSGTYQRVGEARERRADFRLICATCRDLPAMVAAGTFRGDLFYRIHGACVTIPALRERTDAVWLAERLLEALSPNASTAPRLADDAEQYVAEHGWPGNVRELKSAMAHALALAAGEPWIRREHLPSPLASSRPPARAAAAAEPMTKKRIVRDAIEATLGSCAGNVSEAARRLGVGRGTIYRAVKSLKSD